MPRKNVVGSPAKKSRRNRQKHKEDTHEHPHEAKYIDDEEEWDKYTEEEEWDDSRYEDEWDQYPDDEEYDYSDEYN